MKLKLFIVLQLFIFFTSAVKADWQAQTSGTTENLFSSYFINTNTGWVVGDEGVIYKTTNGGVTGFQPISNVMPEKFSLHQNYYSFLLKL